MTRAIWSVVGLALVTALALSLYVIVLSLLGIFIGAG
jgi:hypothetical protein